jgi:hypothetical protein
VRLVWDDAWAAARSAAGAAGVLGHDDRRDRRGCAAGTGSARIAEIWTFASAATGGRLLANTSAPFPAPWSG